MANNKFRPHHPTDHPAATGFPSPAMEYEAPTLDLNRLLVQHPAATFFFRFIGHQGEKMGVVNGDLLLVDRSVPPSKGRMLLIERDGEWALCRSPVAASKDESLRVWGVVAWILHRP